MNRKRQLPVEMRAHAVERTGASLRKLFAHLDALEREILHGREPEEPLDLKHICIGAGLNPKFLYGKKHNDPTKANSTRETVENRIRKLIELLNERNKRSFETLKQSEANRLRSEATYWKERYEKLAQHTHFWFTRMREQQRTIRDLREAADADKGPRTAGQP